MSRAVRLPDPADPVTRLPDPATRDRSLPPTTVPPEPPAPPLSDLLAGGERAAAARGYWREWRKAAVAEVLFRLFSALPPALASNLGARLGRRRAARGGARVARAAANIRRIRPDIPDAAIPALVARFYENVGRVYAETPVLHRVVRDGRVRIEGRERFEAARALGPVILVGAHLANWEFFSPVFTAKGERLFGLVDPPRALSRRRIIMRVRTRLGLDPILPTRAGLRQIVQVLEAGGTVSMFCDESDHQARILAPPFGRPLDPAANLLRVARLARRSGATLLPWHVERTGPARYTVWIQEPLELPGAGADDPATADALAIAAVLEARIRENIADWYMLDNRL